MSWQSYVDDRLLATGAASEAAIYGIGGDVWAASRGFVLHDDEFQTIANGFDNFDDIMSAGFYINGEKYSTASVNEDYIYGKKSFSGAVLFKTKQTIIIALHDSTIKASDCAKLTGDLANYLISLGF